MKKFRVVAVTILLLCLASCQNTGENFEGVSITYEKTPDIDESMSEPVSETVVDSFPEWDSQNTETSLTISHNNEDITEHQVNSTPCNNDNPDFLAYNTDTRTFDSIRSMKEELEKNSQANNISFYELHGLQSAYSESWVEWAGGTDYFIYYTNADKVVAFMPFESESDLTTEKDDWLSNHGTYESLLANELIHDVVKTEIPTDYGISYECTYNTRVMTGLKIRYYEYQDSITGRTYILSVDLSPDGVSESFMLFVFDKDKSFMCSGTASDISLEVVDELYSVTVEQIMLER